MVKVAAEQTALQCARCAGQCVYAPVSGGLQCTSCGTTTALETETDHLAAQEFGYAEGAPEPDPPILTEERSYQCRTCGGEVLFTGAALSEHCPYCNGAVVLGTADAGYRTKALIPFQVDADFARRQMLAWVGRRIAAPGDLAPTMTEARLAGLYAPFWTFDSDEAVSYWAKYRTGSGKQRRTRNTSGALRLSFDDLLMPASPHVTPLIRDGILHDFNPRDLRPYHVGYLAGFAAERHHQSVAQGLAANREDKDLLIRNRIKRHINKSGVHAIQFQTDTTGIHYRRILLPVWIAHYTYGGKAMKVVVSGIDGRTFGERPFSHWKIAAYAAALSAVAIALGVLWGAAGLL